jgi:hypothetical protein
MRDTTSIKTKERYHPCHPSSSLLGLACSHATTVWMSGCCSSKRLTTSLAIVPAIGTRGLGLLCQDHWPAFKLFPLMFFLGRLKQGRICHLKTFAIVDFIILSDLRDRPDTDGSLWREDSSASCSPLKSSETVRTCLPVQMRMNEYGDLISWTSSVTG